MPSWTRSPELVAVVAALAVVLVASPTLAVAEPSTVTDVGVTALDGGHVSTEFAVQSSVTRENPSESTRAGSNTALATSVSFEYHPSSQTSHIVVFFTLAVLLVVTSYWLRTTRSTRGASLFALAVFLTSVRLGVDVLRGLLGDVWTVHSVLAGVNVLLTLTILLVFLRFAGRYADVEWLHDRRATCVSAGLGSAATLLVVTNPVHSLVFSEFVEVSTPFAYVGVEFGPLGWALFALNGGLLVAGAGFVATSFTVTERPAWWPATVLSIGLYLAVMLGGMSVLDRGPLTLFDYSALGLAGFVGMTTVALLGHGLRRLEITARASILEEMDDAIFILNDERTVLDWNAGAEERFPGVRAGRPFTDLVGDGHEWPVPGETRSVERSALEIESPARPAGGNASRSDETASEQNGEADPPREGTSDGSGEEAHYLVQTNSVTTVTNDNIGYTVRFVDVTDLERRARALRRKNEQLDQFADIVTRDLRDPQRRASEYVETIEDETPEDPDATVESHAIRGYVGRIQSALDRMQTIIDDILTLARSGDPVDDATPVDFRTVADESWSRVDTEQATLSVESTGTIHADSDGFARILENLFQNAVDHGGSDVAVTAGLTDDGFYVSDDGEGIPDEIRHQLFEQGFSTSEEKTGLGLTIVDQLAESHGWTLSLDARQGGTRIVCEGARTTV